MHPPILPARRLPAAPAVRPRPAFRVPRRWIAAAALAACAAAVRAEAQPCGTRSTPAPTLTAGQAVRGTLAREDFTLPGDRYDGTDPCTGRPYDSYFYEAQAGERLTFVLESREIDPEITATTHWRGGGPKDVTEQRGRRGRTLSATGTVPAAGRILIQVASNVSMGRPGSFGAYTLTVRSNRPAGASSPSPSQSQPSPQSQPQPQTGGAEVRAGQTVRGRLSASDSRLGDGSHYRDHIYRARRGERFVVTLESADFDAVLLVGRQDGNRLVDEVIDDDGAGGTNSRVEYAANREGPLVLRVNTLGGGETGAYTLRVEAADGSGPSPSPSPSDPAAGGNASAGLPALRLGRPVEGELAAGDEMLDDGSYHDDYTYRARRGERLVIRLSSDDFDAVVAAGILGSEGTGNAQMDDDGGGGTNARLEYTADRDGVLLIRANSLSAGETGRYTLVVESARTSAAPAESAAPNTVADRAPSLAARGWTPAAASPSATRADARLSAPALPAASLPRPPAISNRGRAWLMAGLGVGMIFGGLQIEETPAEPLGALIRYTGYALIALAPLGGG